MDRRAFCRTIVVGGVLVASSNHLALADVAPDTAGEIVKDYLTKIKNFNHIFKDDIILRGERYVMLERVVKHLRRLQVAIGYANFSLLGFDQAIAFAARTGSVGAFTKDEKAFLEQIFYTKASDYGFMGDKVLDKLTESIPSRELFKVPRTGHYLFRGESTRLYEKIRRDVGPGVMLTSGVRGIVKQMDLFLSKAVESGGNLSMASRSLAPPGHSFHGVGDFDVGKTGFGARNFTEDFANTDEFKRLIDLGYIRIRYDETNPFGVRYEPWHIKVV